MGYTLNAVKGVSWLGALQIATRGFTLVRIVILARLLSTTQFGLFGIATLVLGFVEIVTETGINVFLIQEQEDIKEYLHTAWIVSIIRGFLIALLIAVTAPFIALFFHSPDALPLLLFITLVPIFRGFINPAVVTFQKELHFHKEFWYRLIIFAVDASTAIIVAFFTRSAISVVWGFVLGAFAEMVLSFLFVKPWPQFIFEKQKLLKVIHRGKWVTLAGILDYFYANGDDVIVGRMLPVSFLGLYQNAYRIAELPLTEIAGVISKVTFPVFSKIAGDLERLRKAFFKTTGVIALLVIPIGILFFLFPTEIIELLLGKNWIAAAPALQALSIFGILRALLGSANILFLAVKKQEYVSITNLVGTVGLLASIVPLVSFYGIVGASFASTFGLLLSFPFVLYFTWKILR